MTETATTSGMLTGKVVIVTGASTGIGAASAVLFAREGATVVLAARTEDKLGKVTAEITGEGGQASYVVCDVSDAASVRNLVDITVERHGRLDGAFNNAGVLTPAQTPLADVPEAEFDELFAINVKGLWLAMR
ncbi:SDR family NAD(P)-dependent oxidoreductase, partial [Kibdelosporangium lantanae]